MVTEIQLEVSRAILDAFVEGMRVGKTREREDIAAWVADTDNEEWAFLTQDQLAAAIRARGNE